eukprot:scaffold110122_cov48-Phaeocystis_antarctica.AAC.2
MPARPAFTIVCLHDAADCPQLIGLWRRLRRAFVEEQLEEARRHRAPRHVAARGEALGRHGEERAARRRLPRCDGWGGL